MIIASLDFETANRSRVSICAAGVVVFEDGLLTESRHWLIRPPKGHGWFDEDFTECHGLTHLDVREAPEFPAIAPELLALLTRADVVVAHNAGFDIGHLRQTLAHFDLPCPEFSYLCTLKLARRVWPDLPDHKLSTLAAKIGHEFNHHHAQADAETAGRVLLAMMEQTSTNALGGLLQLVGVEPSNLSVGQPQF